MDSNVGEERGAEEAVVISSGSSAGKENEPPEMPPWRFGLLCFGLSTGLFLSFLDTSIVATSLFSIGSDFNDFGTVNWVALAYTLSYLGCAVLLARISDVVGRRNAFMASYVVFIAFSLGCGFAQSLQQLIACRALQGLGGSGLYSIVMITLPEVSPPRHMQHLAGLIGIVITISSVLGPVLGGVLTKYTTWRWIFWINGPFGAASMLLFYLTWPKPQYLPVIEYRSWRELDYLGSVLLIAAAVLIVFPFQSAGATGDQWSQVIFIVPIVFGVLALIALFAWSVFMERRWGETMAAALPMRLMRNRAYASATLNTMLLGFPYIMTIYAFPLRLQVVNKKDPLMAGLLLLPMLGLSAIGSAVAGALNGKKDRSFETLLVATSLMVIGCGLSTTLSGSIELEAKALGFLVFIGLGFGMTVSTTTMITSIQSSLRDHATAQGIVAQVRVLGGSIGIAASSAILGVIMRTRFGGDISPGQLAALESGATETLGSGLDLEAARQAYANAFSKDMKVCAIVSGIAILTSLGTFSRNRPTPEEHRKRQIKDEADRKQAVAGSQPSQNEA
ncbi:major facilitator superfamily transporter [Xylariaceae sp. FL0016]|nr:major facilitator superfamily transporter [Xylariaceae sp. FL0016]